MARPVLKSEKWKECCNSGYSIFHLYKKTAVHPGGITAVFFGIYIIFCRPCGADNRETLRMKAVSF